MSSLILPESHQSPFLEKNLAALFKRYPYEKTRLTPILSKQAPLYPLVNVEMPAAPSKPPIRILLLLGIVNPQFVAQLLNDKNVRKENFKLFIFEQDEEFAAFCFQQTDLTQIINYDRTEWFICHKKESLKPALFRALKPEGVTSMMLNVQSLEVAAPKSKEIEEFYNAVPSSYNETAYHVLHNHGNLDDSLLGVDVTVRNKKYLLESPGIRELKDHYKGCAALVVGAGPSLDSALETIKKYNDRVVIIAADAALKPLINAGIRVDYVTSMERLNAYQKPFFENLENVGADLVAYPVVHPDVLDLYPGTVRMVYRNYSFYAYFEKAYPKGILSAGGSTSHLSLRLADYLGCRRVFMIGLDSCYQEKDGLYRSHCSGTGHPKWGEYIELDRFNKEFKHQPAISGVNNLGESVVTNLTYYQWSKEFSEELAVLGQRIIIKNSSPTGLAIDGIPYIPLEEGLKNLDPNLPEKPVAGKVTYYRSWDNKELRKNFEGWLRGSEDASKEADALLQMEVIDQSRFNALMYVYNFRFCIDDLFVAFIVQCCASQFFQMENKWWSLDLGHETELKEKTQVLKERFELFRNVLVRLIDIFKEETSGGQ